MENKLERETMAKILLAKQQKRHFTLALEHFRGIAPRKFSNFDFSVWSGLTICTITWHEKPERPEDFSCLTENNNI